MHMEGTHPQQWNTQQVRTWITWCSAEFSLNLHTSQLDTFAMNGKALMMLQKEDFCERIPGAGDVIHNALHELSKSCPPPMPTRVWPYPFPETLHSAYSVHMPRHVTWPEARPPDTANLFPLREYPCLDSEYAGNVMWSSQAIKTEGDVDIPITLDDHVSEQTRSPSPPAVSNERPICNEGRLLANTRNSPKSFQNADSTSLPPRKRRDMLAFEQIKSNVTSGHEHESAQGGKKPEINAGSNNKLLWEFISELLQKPRMEKPVRWHDSSTMTFRITDTTGLAKLWGEHKQKENMTYEKLSRALRYYYKMAIISKVRGKKLTYRFTTPPTQIKKGIRGAKPGVPHKRRKMVDKNTTNKAKRTIAKKKEEGAILDLSVKHSKMFAKKRKKKQLAPAPSPCDPSSTSSDRVPQRDTHCPAVNERRDANLMDRDVCTPETSTNTQESDHGCDSGGLDLRCLRKVMQDNCSSSTIPSTERCLTYNSPVNDTRHRVPGHLKRHHTGVSALSRDMTHFHSDSSAFSVVNPLTAAFGSRGFGRVSGYPEHYYQDNAASSSSENHTDYVSFVLSS